MAPGTAPATRGQNHYAPGAENDELAEIINGTGPYMLESWTPGEGWVLTANENYWRGDDMPVWEGGPAGQPAVKRIVHSWWTNGALASPCCKPATLNGSLFL